LSIRQATACKQCLICSVDDNTEYFITQVAFMLQTDRPVAITRALAQAGPLVARLRASGIDARIFPLLDIQSLPDTRELQRVLERLSDYVMVAFVSPNAIDAAFEHIHDWPAGLTAAVVGEGSRQALARHGMTPERAPIVSPANLQRTDSETLLEVLADRLRDAGVEVEQVAAYRRCPPVMNDVRRSQLIELLDSGSDWVITSSEALRYLKEMTLEVAGAEAWATLQMSALIVPHERIAYTAEELGFQRLIRTASGDEALFAAIQSRT
jgi:uroporphyrinogen-III synthase